MVIKANRLVVIASIIIISVAITTFMVLRNNQQSYETQVSYGSQPGLPSKYQFKVQEWGDKFETLDQANKKLKYKLVLPNVTKGKQLDGIYVEKSPEVPDERSTYVIYKDGLEFRAVPQVFSDDEARAHIEQIISERSEHYFRVTIHGKLGYGVEPHAVNIGSAEIKNPGVVYWWEDGIGYSVIGRDMRTQVLLEIAESIKLK